MISQKEVIDQEIDAEEIQFQIRHLINTIAEDTTFKIHDYAKHLENVPEAYRELDEMPRDVERQMIESAVIAKIQEAVSEYSNEE